MHIPLCYMSYWYLTNTILCVRGKWTKERTMYYGVLVLFGCICRFVYWYYRFLLVCLSVHHLVHLWNGTLAVIPNMYGISSISLPSSILFVWRLGLWPWFWVCTGYPVFVCLAISDTCRDRICGRHPRYVWDIQYLFA